MTAEPGNNARSSPDSNSLLAYKLLADSWGEENNNVFKQLMKDELKYLASGISVLQADPVLAMHYGGVNLNSAEKVADILKSKVGELEIKNRLEPTASILLKHKYATDSLNSLEPGKANAIGYSKDNKSLEFRVSAPPPMSATNEATSNPYNFFQDPGIKGGLLNNEKGNNDN